MAAKKHNKIRAEFRKNYGSRRRERGLTSQYERETLDEDAVEYGERVSGKGELTRRRVVVGQQVDQEDAGHAVQPDVDLAQCLPGRVLSVHGLSSVVETPSGERYRCAVRRLLKTLSTDQRHVVAAGDRVLIRPVGQQEGFIERIEPRRGIISRTSKGRQHVLVANVDQLFIVASAAQPDLKPNLIDRLIVTAEKGGVAPVVCINKVDLVDLAELMPIVGVYGQLGYRVLLLSAATGFGVPQLRRLAAGRQSVVTGQSGVGKSSLLNLLEPGLELQVAAVSAENEKGRHTTTAARLIPLAYGGYIVDTPGIRQFALWDVTPEEIAGFYRDLRPYVSHCRYPDCTHTHEDFCAVKAAVAEGRIDMRRYDSYCHLLAGDEA